MDLGTFALLRDPVIVVEMAALTFVALHLWRVLLADSSKQIRASLALPTSLHSPLERAREKAQAAAEIDTRVYSFAGVGSLISYPKRSLGVQRALF